jgi:L-iditol 2-dehydrogenase
MKAAIYKGIENFEIESVPVLDPENGQLLLKVDYCAICGSDLHGYKIGQDAKPGSIMGHEYAGTIQKIGSNVNSDLKVGDRITVCGMSPCGMCDKCIRGYANLCPNKIPTKGGGFAEYTTPPPQRAIPMYYKLPENVSTLEGSMIEPLSVGVHAAKKINYSMYDDIVIFGAGTIGLCALMAVKAISRTARVFQVDISEPRLELAKKLGADFVINTAKISDAYKVVEEVVGVRKNPYGYPGLVDAVIECAGVPFTCELAQKIVNSGGQIIQVALNETDINIDVKMLLQKEVKWEGIYAYIYDYADAIKMVSSGLAPVKELVTDIYKLDDINEAFEKQADTKASVKVIIDCRS